MKKVLLVLGLAMCSSMAIAQNPFTRESFPRAKQPTISFAELNAKAPVDYKASIVAKRKEEVIENIIKKQYEEYDSLIDREFWDGLKVTDEGITTVSFFSVLESHLKF